MPGVPAAYQAPNRTQNFRTYFAPSGIRLRPRTDTATRWEWGLSLTGYGYAGDIQTVAEAELSVFENRTEYRRGEITEWYVNDERGLEQGFTIASPPPASPRAGSENGNRGSLVLVLALAGDLTPTLTGAGTAIDFTTAGGAPIIHYSDLVAYDAAGKTLPARMQLSGCQDDLPPVACYLQLVVDDSDARYPITIDPLASAPDWSAGGAQAGADYGYAVSTAGDVNGDGYDDVIIGAPLYDDGEMDEGRVFVYYGSNSGLGTPAAWTAASDQGDANFGYAVATAGDVNGDGYADVIIGAPLYDDSATDEGRVSVYYGSVTGLGATPWTAAGDVNNDGYDDVIIGAHLHDAGQANEGRAFVYYGAAAGLGSAAGWTAEGDQADAYFGRSAGSAGDVNNDGYADVIIGAPKYDNGDPNEGRAYVYHGSAGGLSGAPGWTAESNQANARFGHAVAAAGDANGDGYGDVIVGSPYYDGGEADEGEAALYHGAAAGLNSNPGWTAEGDQAGAYFGLAVGMAGDVNLDGYDDVIIGAPGYNNSQPDEGRVLVYHGAATGLSQVANWTAESDQAGAGLGFSAAAAGDVNDDGYDDVIIGAYLYDGEGSAFSYHGSEFGLSAVAEWTAASDQSGARLGDSVGTAGDVNNDGYDDIIVGAPMYDNGHQNEGRVFVYHGSAAGPSLTADWTAEGEQVNAFFGDSVGTAGDVNNDGYDDVIIGAPNYDDTLHDEGKAFVYYGSGGGLGSTPWTAVEEQAWSLFGTSVGTAGDVNGDGYDDVIIGAPDYDNGDHNEGKVYVYYGSGTGVNTTPGWTAASNQSSANFGNAVGAAGDVNGDNYADVIVGAPKFNNSGQHNEGWAFVFQGGPSGPGANPDWTADSNQANALFGRAVGAAGDVDDDGYDDVIVGAHKYDDGEMDEGQVYVYHGSASGLNTAPGWTAEGDQTAASLGYAVGTAGDVDGDAYDDVIIGAPGYDNGETDEGRAYLYYGSASGLNATTGWTAESDQASAYFGVAVGTAGDVNGDSYADVIVGAPYYNNGQSDEGLVYVFYGAGVCMAPVAAFTGDPVSGQSPLAVAFTNTSTCSDSYLWDFGDSGSSADFEPAHMYTQTGVYTVTLTAYGAGSDDTLTRGNYITVTSPSTRTWQLITTATTPPVWGEYAMAYDGGRDVVVLYGGNATGWPYENVTWEFNGADWSVISTTQQPNAVYGTAMVYDSSQGATLLFGGNDASDVALAETWEFDGADWSLKTTTTTLPSRANHAMVYDPVTGKVFLFGGNNEDTYYNDTWQFDGADWSQVSVIGQSPPARTLHAMAFNSDDDTLLLFGGRDAGGALLDDLWVFDPVTNEWDDMTGLGPAARQAHGLAYDPAWSSLVLVGGVTDDGDTILNDTWHYEGAVWVEANPATGAPVAAYHTLVYDSSRQRIILFVDGETWVYQ